MRVRGKIRKLAFMLMLSLVLTLHLFAEDTSFMGVGSPANGGSCALNVAFYYDPELMQRLTFGFTDSTDINWMDGSLKSDSLYLGTQVMPGRGEQARGIGYTNFYWILRTNKPVKAKLFLNGPLVELNSKNELDWTIKFDSELNGVRVAGNQIDSRNGNTPVEIYSREAGKLEPTMDYIPVEIVTDYANVQKDTQSYKGNIGILVETN